MKQRNETCVMESTSQSQSQRQIGNMGITYNIEPFRVEGEIKNVRVNTHSGIKSKFTHAMIRKLFSTFSCWCYLLMTELLILP